ncbi:MAG: hypothetical protein ACLR2E_06275 [Lachnospiraceae bacterium]
MVRFAIDLEGRMARKETVTECDVDAMMRHYRLEQEASLGESFRNHRRLRPQRSYDALSSHS